MSLWQRCVVGIVALASVLALASGVAQASAPLYVALGDSFSAGPGSGFVPGQLIEDQSVYEPGTNTTTNQCNRSKVAYPSLVASTKGYALRNVSCGSATTETVLVSGQFNEPAQINAVTPNTQIVTLTIGGNDIGFVELVACIATPLAPECKYDSPAVTTTLARLATLQPKVEAVLMQIHTRAPSAKAILVGYPKIVPDTGQPALGCLAFLTQGEQGLANDIERRLGGVLANAAAATGTTYVDAYNPGSPFNTRDSFGLTADACSLSGVRQINGIRLDFPNGSFHPDGYGQRSYATLFNAVA